MFFLKTQIIIKNNNKIKNLKWTLKNSTPRCKQRHILVRGVASKQWGRRASGQHLVVALPKKNTAPPPLPGVGGEVTFWCRKNHPFLGCKKNPKKHGRVWVLVFQLLNCYFHVLPSFGHTLWTVLGTCWLSLKTLDARLNLGWIPLFLVELKYSWAAIKDVRFKQHKSLHTFVVVQLDSARFLINCDFTDKKHTTRVLCLNSSVDIFWGGIKPSIDGKQPQLFQARRVKPKLDENSRTWRFWDPLAMNFAGNFPEPHLENVFFLEAATCGQGKQGEWFSHLQKKWYRNYTFVQITGQTTGSPEKKNWLAVEPNRRFWIHPVSMIELCWNKIT